MRKCKYCGRYYSNHDTCPGCGSVQFEEIRNQGAIRIDKVPQGGYRIKTINYKRTNKLGRILQVIGILFLIYTIFMFIAAYLGVFIISMQPIDITYEGGTDFIDLVFLFVGASFIIPSPVFGLLFLWGGNTLIRNNKRTEEQLERLKTNGVLIKGLKYKMENRQIQILYETHSGVKVPFKSYVINVLPSILPDTCDILFDKDDPGIYYIGFDIY